MAINLLKRLESSVYSFRLTIQRVKAYVNQTIKIVEEFQNHKNNSQINIKDLSFDSDYDFDDHNTTVIFAIGKKVQIDLNDMDYISWLKDLKIDADHMMVVSPDEGGTGRAIYIANVLGLDMGMFYKRRDYTKIVDGRNPIIAHEFLGSNVEGKDIIIIDDMIFVNI